MQKEKIVKLTEALSSAGYEIIKIDRLNNIKHKYWGDTKILLSFTPSNRDEPFTKEKMVKLVEILSSNGNFGILKFELIFDNDDGVYNNIKLHLGRF